MTTQDIAIVWEMDTERYVCEVADLSRCKDNVISYHIQTPHKRYIFVDNIPKCENKEDPTRIEQSSNLLKVWCVHVDPLNLKYWHPINERWVYGIQQYAEIDDRLGADIIKLALEKDTDIVVDQDEQ